MVTLLAQGMSSGDKTRGLFSAGLVMKMRARIVKVAQLLILAVAQLLMLVAEVHLHQ